MGFLAVADHVLGHAVGGDDVGLVGDAEFGQGLRRGFHDRPVRVRSHDDADEWLAAHCWSPSAELVSTGSTPSRMIEAARLARRRSSGMSAAAPTTFTWPILRPGRTDLP